MSSECQKPGRRILRAAVGDQSDLDARIKFKFESGTLDGKSVPNQVHNNDEDSDITITVSLENFERIIDKELNPKLALMTGRMRLRRRHRHCHAARQGIRT